MSIIKKIIVKTVSQGKTKTQIKKEREQFRQTDSSPILIILHILGMLGICTAVKDLVGLRWELWLMLCAFTILFSFMSWYFFFKRKQYFIYMTALICISGVISIVPQMFYLIGFINNSRNYDFNLILSSLSGPTIITFTTLAIYLMFSFEFVLRIHSIPFLLVMAILILPPIFGINTNTMAAILTVLFQIAFTVVNMSSSKNMKKNLKMKRPGKASAAASLFIAILIVLMMIPSFPIEHHNEDELFSSVYTADGYIKDIVAQLSGNSDNTVSGGKVGRGNLHQTGQPLLWIGSNARPTEQLYLHNFRGGYYQDEEWADIHNYGADFAEVPVFSIFREKEWERDILNWYNQYSSDPVNDVYYRYAHHNNKTKTNEENIYTIEELPVNDNEISLSMFDMSGTGNNPMYLPYNTRYSQGSLSQNIREQVDAGQRVYGYSTSYLPRYSASMEGKWNDAPAADYFITRYEEEAKNYYTSFPEKGNERLRQLCSENQFDSLDEITTFILYTLQTHARYSKSPGTAPFNKDIVDYFLFDNGKGYCVHFASAAALMYRSYGIPARYVSGVTVSPSSFSYHEATDSRYPYSYTCQVTDYSAHAWVEIFLRDYGWVTVDATPTENGTMNVSYPGYDKDVMNRIMAEHDWHFKDRSGNDSSETNNSNTDSEDNEDHSYTAILYILIAAAAAILLYIFARYVYLIRQYPKRNSRSMFDLMIRSLHFCGTMKGLYGLEEEFAKQLSENIPVVSIEDCDQLIETMLMINYSNHQPSKEDNDFVHSLCTEIISYLYHHKMPVPKKLLYKFRFGYSSKFHTPPSR